MYSFLRNDFNLLWLFVFVQVLRLRMTERSLSHMLNLVWMSYFTYRFLTFYLAYNTCKCIIFCFCWTRRPRKFHKNQKMVSVPVMVRVRLKNVTAALYWQNQCYKMSEMICSSTLVCPHCLLLPWCLASLPLSTGDTISGNRHLEYKFIRFIFLCISHASY